MSADRSAVGCGDVPTTDAYTGGDGETSGAGLAMTVMLGATASEASPLAKISSAWAAAAHPSESAEYPQTRGPAAHVTTQQVPFIRGSATSNNKFSPSLANGTMTDFPMRDEGASPMIKPPLDATNMSGRDPTTAAAAVDDSTVFAHDTAEGGSPAQLSARASSPLTASLPPPRADAEEGVRRDDAAVEGSCFRRSAAMSMAQSGAVSTSTRFEGSLLGQTVMLSQSTQRRANTMSPSVVVSRSVPPPSANGSRGDGGAQENCQDGADDSSITVSLANSINEGVGPWRRVQLVSLPSSGMAGVSPMPTIPAEPASDAGTPNTQRAKLLRQRSTNDSAAQLEALSSQHTPATSISFSDRTPQREGSPSRPPSSVCSAMDMSRQMNISGMSGSMSFRPPVGGVGLAELPKGCPLAFDGSLKAATPTRGTPTVSPTVQQPKPCQTNRATPTAGSQFVTTFCGRSLGFTNGSGLPLSRGVMGGSGGNPMRSSLSGHVFTNPHDPTAMPKSQRPPVVSMPDVGVFRPWLPLGLEQDGAAAEVAGWTPLGHGPESPGQSCNDPIVSTTIVYARDDEDDDDGCGKKRMAPARPGASGSGFSVNEEGGTPFGGASSTATMGSTPLEMKLQERSMSMSLTIPTSPQAAEGAEDERQGRHPPDSRENGEGEPAAVMPTTCKDVADQTPEGRRQPSLRNRSTSQMNEETHSGVKPDAAAAGITGMAPSTEISTPTRHD